MATSQDSRDEATPTPTATSGHSTPGAQLAADADADADKDVKHEPPSDAVVEDSKDAVVEDSKDAVVEDVADLPMAPRKEDVGREVGETPAGATSPSPSSSTRPEPAHLRGQRPDAISRLDSPGNDDDGVDSKDDGVDAAPSCVVAKTGAQSEVGAEGEGDARAPSAVNGERLECESVVIIDVSGRIDDTSICNEIVAEVSGEMPKEYEEVATLVEDVTVKEEIYPKVHEVVLKVEEIIPTVDKADSKENENVSKSEKDAPKMDEDALKVEDDSLRVGAEVPEVIGDATRVIGDVPTVDEGGRDLADNVAKLDENVPNVADDVPEASKEVPKVIENVLKVDEIDPELRDQVPQDSAIVPELGGNAPDAVVDVPKASNAVPALIADAVRVNEGGLAVQSADLQNSDETILNVSENVPKVSESVPDTAEVVGDGKKNSDDVPVLNKDVIRVSEDVPKLSEGIVKVIGVPIVSEFSTEVTVSKVLEEVPKLLEVVSQVEGVQKVIEKVLKIEEVPKVIEETPKVIEEAPKVIEEVPKVIEEAPKVIEEAPKVIGEAPKVVEEAPKVIEEAPKVIEEAPKVIEEAPKVIEEAPKVVEEAPKVIEEFSKVCDVVPRIEDVPIVIEEAPKVIEDVVKAEEVTVKTTKPAVASKKETGGGKTLIMEGAPSKARTKRRLPWNDMPLADEGPDPEAEFYLGLADTIRDNLDLHLDGKLDPAAPATHVDANGDVAAKAEAGVGGVGEQTTAVATPRSDAAASEEPREPSPTTSRFGVAKKFTAKRRGERSKRPTIRGLSFLDITTQLIVGRKRAATAERLAPPSTPPPPRPTASLTTLGGTDAMSVLGLARAPNPGLPQPETTRAPRPPPTPPASPAPRPPPPPPPPPPAPANLSPRKLSLRQRSTESEDGAKDTRPAEVTLLANGERPAFIEDQGTDTEPDPETAVVPAEAGVSVESSNTAARHDAEPRGSAFSGDWVRPRTYVCAACNAPFADIYDLQEHKWGVHPNAWVCHYEFYDAHLSRTPADTSRMSLELYKRFLQPQGVLAAATALRDDQMQCTKCQRTFAVLPEFHRHILDCGGDTTWMSTMVAASPGGAGARNRSRKWRPFGARRRRGNGGRGRRGMKRNIRGTPGKSPGMRQRSRATDAESIQRMIANLPAKRSTRRAINFQEDIKTRSQATISSNRLLRKRYKVTFVSSFPRPGDKSDTPAPRRLSAATQLVNAALKFPRRRLPPQSPAPAPVIASETLPKPAKARSKVTAKDIAVVQTAPPPAKPSAKLAAKLAAKLSTKSAVKSAAAAKSVSAKALLKSATKATVRVKRSESPKTICPVAKTAKTAKTVSPAKAAKKPVIVVVKKLPTVVKLVKRVPVPAKATAPAKVVTVRTVKVVPIVKATSILGKAKMIVPKRATPAVEPVKSAPKDSTPKAVASTSMSMAGDILRAMRRAMLESEPGAIAARNKRKAADAGSTPSSAQPEAAAGDSPAIVCSHCAGSYTNRTAYMRHRKSCAGASPLKESPVAEAAAFAPPPRVPCDGCGVLLANVKSRDRHLQRCPVLGPRLIAIRTALSATGQARHSAVRRILSVAKANKAANAAIVVAKANKAANAAIVTAKAGPSKPIKGSGSFSAPLKTTKGVSLSTKTAKLVAPVPKKTKPTKTPDQNESGKVAPSDGECPSCGKRFVYRARLAAHRAICRPAVSVGRKPRRARDDDVPLARLFRVKPRSSPRLDGRDMPRLEPIGRADLAPPAAECPVLSPFSDVVDDEEAAVVTDAKALPVVGQDGAKPRGAKARTHTGTGKEPVATDQLDPVAASPLLAGALDAAKTKLLKAKKKSDAVKEFPAAVERSNVGKTFPQSSGAEDVAANNPAATVVAPKGRVPKVKFSAIAADDRTPISPDIKTLSTVKGRIPKALKTPGRLESLDSLEESQRPDKGLEVKVRIPKTQSPARPQGVPIPKALKSRLPAQRPDEEPTALKRRSARVARTQTASPGDSASSRDSGVFVDAESDHTEGGKVARRTKGTGVVAKRDALAQSGAGIVTKDAKLPRIITPGIVAKRDALAQSSLGIVTKDAKLPRILVAGIVTKGGAFAQSSGDTGLASKSSESESDEFAVKVGECNDGALKRGKEVATSDELVGSKEGRGREESFLLRSEERVQTVASSTEDTAEEVIIVAEVKRSGSSAAGRANVCRAALEVSDDEAIEVDRNEMEETGSEANGFGTRLKKNKAIEMVQRKIEELFASTPCNENTRDLKLCKRETKGVAEAVQSKFVDNVEDKRREIEVVSVDSEPEDSVSAPAQADKLVEPEERRRSGSATQHRSTPSPSFAPKRRVSWEGEAVGKRLRLALEYGIRQIDDDVLTAAPIAARGVAAVDRLVRAVVAGNRRSSAAVRDEPMADINILGAACLAPEVLSAPNAEVSMLSLPSAGDETLPKAMLLTRDSSSGAGLLHPTVLPSPVEDVLFGGSESPADVLPLPTEAAPNFVEAVPDAGLAPLKEDGPQSWNAALNSEEDQPSLNATCEAGSVPKDDVVVSHTNEAISAAAEDLSASAESNPSTDQTIVKEVEFKSVDKIPIKENVTFSEVNVESETVIKESSTTVIKPSTTHSPKFKKKLVIIKPKSLSKKPESQKLEPSIKEQAGTEHAESLKEPSTLVLKPITKKPLPLVLEHSNKPVTKKRKSSINELATKLSAKSMALKLSPNEPEKEPLALALEPSKKEQTLTEPAQLAKEPSLKEPLPEAEDMSPNELAPRTKEPPTKEHLSLVLDPPKNKPAAENSIRPTKEASLQKPSKCSAEAKEKAPKELAPTQKEPALVLTPTIKESAKKDPSRNEPEPEIMNVTSKELATTTKEAALVVEPSKEAAIKELYTKESEPETNKATPKELALTRKEPGLILEPSKKEAALVLIPSTKKEAALVLIPSTKKEAAIKDQSTKEPEPETNKVTPKELALTTKEPGLILEPSKEATLVLIPSTKKEAAIKDRSTKELEPETNKVTPKELALTTKEPGLILEPSKMEAALVLIPSTKKEAALVLIPSTKKKAPIKDPSTKKPEPETNKATPKELALTTKEPGLILVPPKEEALVLIPSTKKDAAIKDPSTKKPEPETNKAAPKELALTTKEPGLILKPSKKEAALVLIPSTKKEAALVLIPSTKKEAAIKDPSTKKPEPETNKATPKELALATKEPGLILVPPKEEKLVLIPSTKKEAAIKDPSTKKPEPETNKATPKELALTTKEPGLILEAPKEAALVLIPSTKQRVIKEPETSEVTPKELASAIRKPATAESVRAPKEPTPAANASASMSAKRKARRGKATREPKRPAPAKKEPMPGRLREARRTRCPLSYEEMVDVSSEDSADEDAVVVSRPQPSKDAASPARGRASALKGGFTSPKTKDTPARGFPPTPKDKDISLKAAAPVPKANESPVKGIFPTTTLKDSPAKGVILVPIKGLVLPTRDRPGALPRPNDTKWLILAPIDKQTSTSEVMTITRDKDAANKTPPKDLSMKQPRLELALTMDATNKTPPKDLSVKRPRLELALTKDASEPPPPAVKKTNFVPVVRETKTPPNSGRRFGVGGGDGQCLTSHLSCATCNKHYYSKSTFATHLRSVTHVVRAQLAAQADEARKAPTAAVGNEDRDDDDDVQIVQDSRENIRSSQGSHKEAQVMPKPREEVRVLSAPCDTVQASGKLEKEADLLEAAQLDRLSSATTRDDADDDSALDDAELAQTRRREEERRAASVQSVAQWLAQQDPAATARGKAASVRGVDGAPPAKRRRVKVTARRCSLPLMASSSSCSWADAVPATPPSPLPGDRVHPLACDSSPNRRANPSEWTPANRLAGKAPCYSGFNSSAASKPRGRRVKATPRRRPSKEASRAKSRILQSVYLKQATLLVAAETAPSHHKAVAAKSKLETAKLDKTDAAKVEAEVLAANKAAQAQTEAFPSNADAKRSEPVTGSRPAPTQDRLAVFDFDEEESRDSAPDLRAKPKPPLAVAFGVKPTAAVRPMNRVGRPPKPPPPPTEHETEVPGPCKNAISQAVVDVSNILVLEPSRRRAPVCYTELWDDLESESSLDSVVDEARFISLAAEPENRPRGIREDAEDMAKATEPSATSWVDEDFRPSKPMFRDLWEESETEDGDEAANKSSVLCCVFGKARRPEQTS